MNSLKKILLLSYLLSSNNILSIHCQPVQPEGGEALNIIFSKKILPYVDDRDAIAAIGVWTKEILSEIYLDHTINNIFIEGFAQVDENYINEKANFLILTAYEYLYNQEKLKNVTPALLTSDDDGQIGIEYIILVNKNSNLNSLKDLKNKTISFVDDYSNAVPRLWLDVMLRSEGLSESNKFFKQILTAPNGNQAILKTFFQQSDACIIPKKLLNTSFALNPQLESNLVILKQSVPFIAGIFLTNNKLSTDVRNDFIKSVKIALETERGKQIALFFRTSELHEFKAEYLDNVKSLINQAKKLKIKISD
jgi:ABC-type phosphate/phosphonate transport system substrate-binding protein